MFYDIFSGTASACGVAQSQNGDGFNSLMSSGNAIVVEKGRVYAARIVTKGRAAVTASLVSETGAAVWSTAITPVASMQ